MNQRSSCSPFSIDRLKAMQKETENILLINQRSNCQIFNDLYSLKQNDSLDKLGEFSTQSKISPNYLHSEDQFRSKTYLNNVNFIEKSSYDNQDKFLRRSPTSLQHIPQALFEKGIRDKQASVGGIYEETPKFKVNKFENQIVHFSSQNNDSLQDFEEVEGEKSSCFSFGHGIRDDEEKQKQETNLGVKQSKKIKESSNKKKHVSFCPEVSTCFALTNQQSSQFNDKQYSPAAGPIKSALLGEKHNKNSYCGNDLAKELINQPVFESFSPSLNFPLEQNSSNGQIKMNKPVQQHIISFDLQIPQRDGFQGENKDMHQKYGSITKIPLGDYLTATLPQKQNNEYEQQQIDCQNQVFPSNNGESKLDELRKKLVKSSEKSLIFEIIQASPIRKAQSQEYIETFYQPSSLLREKFNLDSNENKCNSLENFQTDRIPSKEIILYTREEKENPKASEVPKAKIADNSIANIFLSNSQKEDFFQNQYQPNELLKQSKHLIQDIQDDTFMTQQILRKVTESQGIQKKTAEILASIKTDKKKCEELQQHQENLSNSQKTEQNLRENEQNIPIIYSFDDSSKSSSKYPSQQKIQITSPNSNCLNQQNYNISIPSKQRIQINENSIPKIFTATINLDNLIDKPKSQFQNSFTNNFPKSSSENNIINKLNFHQQENEQNEKSMITPFLGALNLDLSQNVNVSQESGNNINHLLHSVLPKQNSSSSTSNKVAQAQIFQTTPNNNISSFSKELKLFNTSQTSQIPTATQSPQHPTNLLQLGASSSVFSSRANNTTFATMCSSPYVSDTQECLSNSYLKPSPMPIISNSILLNNQQKKNCNSTNSVNKEQSTSFSSQTSSFASQHISSQRRIMEFAKVASSLDLSQPQYNKTLTNSRNEQSPQKQNGALRQSTISLSSNNLNNSQELINTDSKSIPASKIKKNSFASYICKSSSYIRVPSPSKLRQPTPISNHSAAQQQDHQQVQGNSSQGRQIFQQSSSEKIGELHPKKTEVSSKNGQFNLNKNLPNKKGIGSSYSITASYKTPQKYARQSQSQLFPNQTAGGNIHFKDRLAYSCYYHQAVSINMEGEKACLQNFNSSETSIPYQ